MVRDVESEVEHQAVELERRFGRERLTRIAGHRARSWLDAARRARDAGQDWEHASRRAAAWARIQGGRDALD